MGGKSEAPAAPDYTGAAQATAQGNQEAAIAAQEGSMVNQYTPYGSLVYNQSGTSASGNPTYSATQTLAPEQQQLLDIQNQASLGLGQTMNQGVGYVQDMLNNPFDTSKLPNMPVTGDNAGRDAMTQSIIDRQQPMWDKQRSQGEADLLARGFNPGGEAWKSKQDDMNRGENDARLAAIQAGGQEQSRLFGLGTTARQNALSEQSFLRNEPLNTLNAVRTGAQVTGPQYVNAPQQQGTTGPDYLGAASALGNYNMGANNASQGGQNAMMQGLFGLGSSFLGNYNWGG